MIHRLEIKDMQFFIQMQQFMSKEETDKVKIKCNINVFQDLLNIKENYPWFSLISIYPTEAETQNLVNDKVLED